MQLFLEQCASGVAMGSIYALITLGLALVYGILRILHVAHAGIYAVGAYLALGVFSLTDSLVLAALGAMGGCALLGVAMERFIYLPLLSFPPFVPLISSILELGGRSVSALVLAAMWGYFGICCASPICSLVTN